ncbi:MAG TPA: M20/M25/M40 family metallo-hydrolase [Kofleriaceae bacterium]|nr:M20/M25/M40 family metallo-hydrolase [Kofleriaceae bacterium]
MTTTTATTVPTTAAVLAVALAACAPAAGTAPAPSWVTDTGTFQPAAAARSPLARTYGETAAKIIAAARADRGAYAKLVRLTDRIGHRLSGSASLDRAIAWAAQAMKDDGHEVRTEPVAVPHWVRGTERAELVSPIERTLTVLGLGGTVPTPKGGLTAPVVVIRSWDELEQQADRVKGAIVLYDVAMPAWSEDKGSGYGDTAPYRSRGPSRAAKLGAAGVLIRSITAHSLRTPHTGALSYDPALPKIPAAAISVEDALLIARLAAQGPVTVRMQLESQQLPDATSANVIGELRGRERPDEVVLLGAHLDSWDVGQGAHDDGAGCVQVMQALTVLRTLGLSPRRTIRVVLFTNEENGLRGGKTYAQAHTAELDRTVLALETDSGGFAPRGFSVEARPEVSPRVVARLAQIAALAGPLALKVTAGHGGADVGPLVPAGVPAVGLVTDGRLYFDYHHSEADTLDKVDAADLADDVAAIAVLAYVVADLPDRVDAP